MTPPLDSFGHQCRKLAEVIAAAQQNRSSSSPCPPPPYSSTIKPFHVQENTSNLPDLHFDYDEDDEDEGEDGSDGDETSSHAAPITIKIDASISIVGDRNTIVVPPMSRLLTTRSNNSGTRGDETRHDSDNGLASTSRGHDYSPSQCPSSPSTHQAAAQLQYFQRQRQTQYVDLVNMLVSGLFVDRASGDNPSRPMDIDIDSGIRIRGTGNVVCAGRALARHSINNATATNPQQEAAQSSSIPETKEQHVPPTTAGDQITPTTLTTLNAKRKRSDSEPLTFYQAKILKMT